MKKLAESIYAALLRLKEDYAVFCRDGDVVDSRAPVSEADIVSDIRSRLLPVARKWDCTVHQEIRAVTEDLPGTEHYRHLPRLDLVLLADKDGDSWLDAAKELQDRYAKGSVEARFLAVPSRFIRAAVEVKIQSLPANSKKDVDGLKNLRDKHPGCHCFFVLLNARGRVRDHDRIVRYCREANIGVIEHTSRR